MWQVEQDRSRNLVVEEALLWARAVPNESRPGHWVLVHVFRHPSGQNGWQRSVSFVERKPESPWPHTILGYREFATPPTAPAICEFIRHVRGPVPGSGFTRVSGGFPKDKWLKATGQMPPCTFSGVVVATGR